MKNISQEMIKERSPNWYKSIPNLQNLQIETNYHKTKISKLIDIFTRHHQSQITHLLVQHIHSKYYLNIQHI